MHPGKKRASIVKAVLLIACLVGGWALAQQASSPQTVTFGRPVHFLAPDGSDVEVEAGAYEVDSPGELRLRLSPVAGAAPLFIQALPTTHSEAVESPVVLTVVTDEDITHVVLLLSDKTALDAPGSLSGIRSRTDVPQRLSTLQLKQAVGSQLLLSGSPTAPLAVNPPPGAVITGPAVRFQWQQSPGQPAPSRYEICVSELNQPCTGPHVVVFKITGMLLTEPLPPKQLGVGPRPGSPDFERQAGTSGTAPYFYNVTLPFQFQGKRLQWSIAGCVPTAGQAAFIGQTPESCTASTPRPITWVLSPPALNMPAENTLLQTLTPAFSWNYGNQQGVEYFLVCIFKPNVPCPVQPSVQPYVFVALVQNALGFTPPQDLSPFMGHTLHWTVAACNAALGCVYQPQYRRFQVPIVDGSFDSIYEVSQNAKCKNCHQMHRENETYRRHVKLGRFTRDEIPPSAVDGVLREGGRLTETTKKCSNCHTSATGFTDEWRAPVRMFGLPREESFEQLIDGNLCFQFKAEPALKRGGRDHLVNDSNILWAVGRIPGLGRARWQQKVDAWFKAGAPCGPKDGRRHGQFTP